MRVDPFYRLAPFIREYIYTHRWTELRAVQVEACRVIFGTDRHLLLATGTASGKTEAAFLPILTLLHENPSASVGVLYIGPLKALINDQFVRLNDLLREAEIPVWHWHGDVAQNRKHRLLKKPCGVLQITPESLESLLINKYSELPKLFGDLRFIVIDEVHVFMDSDRGQQVLCQLSRLAKFMNSEPRRIGLSATLGDYRLAEKWLKSGTKKEVITPIIKAGQQKIRLAVEHFYVSDDADQIEESDKITSYDRYIFEQSKMRKCLIFTNNRAGAESVIASLRQVAESEGLPDIYHVHHGSISASLREAAESAMRDSTYPAVTAATVTLELGIDIGQLERVIQLNAPFSVSSFLQRLGRSGRRGNPSEMWFVCGEDKLADNDPLPAEIPWHLLQAIAIIQLYLEEKWIEPIHAVKYPFSLLYHQIMSTLVSMGELSPAALAHHVLTLPPFRSISQDDFRTLLLHLIKIDHIQRTEEGGLIIGLNGESSVRNFRFYAVFQDNDDYKVLYESRTIGTIIMPPTPGERFPLAGRTWEVLDIDPKGRKVFVKPVKGKVKGHWQGSSGNVHSKILQRMRQVLIEDVDYPYLQSGAKERLKEARYFSQNMNLSRRNIIALGDYTYCIFPWMGTIAFRTLIRCLRRLNIFLTGWLSPYFITLNWERGDEYDLQYQISSLCQRNISEENLVNRSEASRLQMQKYDEFIPPLLLHKAFAHNELDMSELRKCINNWKII